MKSNSFVHLQASHNKKYNEFEEKFRMKVYMENRHKIARHNLQYENGEKSYSMAMNHFGDLVTRHSDSLLTFS